MGFDTYIEVGDRQLTTYRKQAGDLPRFLFARSDLAITGGDEHNPPDRVAFESTAEATLKVLDEQGLGWDASVAAYGSIRSGGNAEAFLSGMYMAELWGDGLTEAEIDQLVEEKLSSQRMAEPATDLSHLGQLIAGHWLDSKRDTVLFLSELYWGDTPPASSSTLSQTIFAARDAGLQELPSARAVETLSVLFREARLVAWPILMTVFLRHLPPTTPVRYELSEAIDEFDMSSVPDTTEVVDRYWAGTGESIAGYARSLGVLFGVLADFETRLGPQYWFGQAAAAMHLLEELNRDRSASTTKARGDALERLMEALFNAEGPELKVTEKNFSTREEEIDLVLRNNLPDPYWTAQGSPYWFVECKNWQSPVGVAELRTFESKMDDRKSTVRIGVFVSTGGYYETFVERLKIAQTKNIGVIYAITLDDLRGLLERRERLSAWLMGAGAMRAFGSELTTT